MLTDSAPSLERMVSSSTAHRRVGAATVAAVVILLVTGSGFGPRDRGGPPPGFGAPQTPAPSFDGDPS